MAGFERALKKLVEDPRYRNAVAKDHSVLLKEFKLDTKEMLLLMQVWQASGGRRGARALSSWFLCHCCCCGSLA
jgi:hypothetical protein